MNNWNSLHTLESLIIAVTWGSIFCILNLREPTVSDGISNMIWRQLEVSFCIGSFGSFGISGISPLTFSLYCSKYSVSFLFPAKYSTLVLDWQAVYSRLGDLVPAHSCKHIGLRECCSNAWQTFNIAITHQRKAQTHNLLVLLKHVSYSFFEEVSVYFQSRICLLGILSKLTPSGHKQGCEVTYLMNFALFTSGYLIDFTGYWIIKDDVCSFPNMF